MDFLDYIGISIAGLLTGAMAGGIGGLSLGWLLAFNYHRRSPSDPGDAPVYVAIGLAVAGSCVGAIVGLVISMIYSVRLAKRRKDQRLSIGPSDKLFLPE